MRIKLLRLHHYIMTHPMLIYWGGVFDTLLIIAITYAIFRWVK